MNALLENLPNWLTHPTLRKWSEALLGLVFILFVFSVLRRFLAKRITALETRYHTRKIITFISYFVIAIYIAALFSDRLGQLTVIFGVAGAGIAFVVQEVIASFAGWVAISFGQFYRPGDRVPLGGIMVREILLKAATDIDGEDIPGAQAQWRMMVHKYLIEDAKVEPMVTLVANDNWLEFTVRYIVSYKQCRSQKDLLFARILDELDNTAGKVSVASTTMQLVDAPVVDVRLRGYEPPCLEKT
jgi:hypothetical protein